MTQVHDAQKVLSDLESKLADTRQWQLEIETASKNVSFEAHTAGGEARERLDNLTSQAVGAAREAESLGAAISEAKLRLAAAVAAETDAAEQDKARMALGLVSGFLARGRALDEKLTAFIEEYQALRGDFHDLERTGYPPSSWSLVEINLKNAVASRLMGTPMQTDFLPPAKRHTFEEVITGWGNSVRMRAERRLAKDNQDTAA
jgi:hypothetical protein